MKFDNGSIHQKLSASLLTPARPLQTPLYLHTSL